MQRLRHFDEIGQIGLGEAGYKIGIDKVQTKQTNRKQKKVVVKKRSSQVGSICGVDLPDRLDGRIGWVENANKRTVEQAGWAE